MFPLIKDHSVFDAFQPARVTPSATCVTADNAVCRNIDIFKDHSTSLKHRTIPAVVLFLILCTYVMVQPIIYCQPSVFINSFYCSNDILRILLHYCIFPLFFVSRIEYIFFKKHIIPNTICFVVTGLYLSLHINYHNGLILLSYLCKKYIACILLFSFIV